jgi:hypothetical protein
LGAYGGAGLAGGLAEAGASSLANAAPEAAAGLGAVAPEAAAAAAAPGTSMMPSALTGAPTGALGSGMYVDPLTQQSLGMQTSSMFPQTGMVHHSFSVSLS